MAIEYLGLSSINGPLVVLEGVENAFYDEIVEFIVDHNTRKMGRIVELDEDKAVIQVFEGTENMSLDNTHTRLTGHPMEVTVSEEMLGRTFNGIGEAIDGLGPIADAEKRDVNGLPLNPVPSVSVSFFLLSDIPAFFACTDTVCKPPGNINAASRHAVSINAVIFLHWNLFRIKDTSLSFVSCSLRSIPILPA